MTAYRIRKTFPLFVSTLFAVGALHMPATAQAPKKALGVEDYPRWKSINGGTLSGDGKWVTYTLAYTNTAPADTRPVLHLLRLDTNQDIEVANASGGSFLRRTRAGSRISSTPVLAAAVDAALVAVGRRPRRPARRALRRQGVRRDAVRRAPRHRRRQASRAAQPRHGRGAVMAGHPVIHLRRELQSSRAASACARCTAARPVDAAAPARRAERGSRQEAVAESAAGARGADVILHDLANGRDQLLGAVGDISFNKRGDLLAYTVDAAPRDGNGLSVVELKSGRVSTLDNDARVYSRLTWNDGGTGLAVLKGVDVDRMRERDNVLLVYPDVYAALAEPEAVPVKFDPAKAGGFPQGIRVERSRGAGLERRRQAHLFRREGAGVRQPTRPTGVAVPTR